MEFYLINTLLDISTESELNKAEQQALKLIAKEVKQLIRENLRLKKQLDLYEKTQTLENA